MKTTIRAELVAVQQGMYMNYVFKNLDCPENSAFRYITVTKCPNWQYFNNAQIGDIGFLQYEYVEAGTEYFDVSKNVNDTYKYTANYFINFIKDNTKDNAKEFNF